MPTKSILAIILAFFVLVRWVVIAHAQYVEPPTPGKKCVAGACEGDSSGGGINIIGILERLFEVISGPSEPRSTEARRRAERERYYAEERRQREQADREYEQERRSRLRELAEGFVDLLPPAIIRGQEVRSLPAGTRFFGIDGPQDFEEAARVPERGVTPGTRVSTESLRRVLSVLKAAQSASAADAKFLAEQASLAMQGAPLDVIVPASPSIRQPSGEDVREFTRLATVVEESRRRVTEVVRERLHVEEELYRAGTPDSQNPLWGKWKDLNKREEQEMANWKEKQEELDRFVVIMMQ